jgi:molybdenum cofactor synthesis domain-containing protein
MAEVVGIGRMTVLRIAILTVSDRSSQGKREDLSGPALEIAVIENGWRVEDKLIVPDEKTDIQTVLKRWTASDSIDVVLTTGGTGFAPRDITPEATEEIIERKTPGLVEAMRAESLKITKNAVLSRAVAGIRGRTLIINLPGSPKAAVENFEVIAPVLEHAVMLLKDDPSAEAGH